MKALHIEMEDPLVYAGCFSTVSHVVTYFFRIFMCNALILLVHFLAIMVHFTAITVIVLVHFMAITVGVLVHFMAITVGVLVHFMAITSLVLVHFLSFASKNFSFLLVTLLLFLKEIKEKNKNTLRN